MKSRTRSPRSKKKAGLGGGYLLKLTILISGLMIANSYLVGLVVRANVRYLPDVLDDVRLYQFFQVFVPIVCVGIQFWIYDRIKDQRLAHAKTG